jgi:hypothetical protein
MTRTGLEPYTHIPYVETQGAEQGESACVLDGDAFSV